MIRLETGVRHGAPSIGVRLACRAFLPALPHTLPSLPSLPLDEGLC